MVWLFRFLATVGFLGEHLPAPGTTVGSLAGLGFFLLFPEAGLRLAVGVGLTLLAPLVCGREAVRRGETDPTVFLARLRLGRLAEARGELERARQYYEEVARALPMTSVGGEARLALQSLLEAHPELAPEPAGSGSTFEIGPTNAGFSAPGGSTPAP